MVWRRTLPTRGAEGTSGHFAHHDPIKEWLDAKNQVSVQLEDRQFGTLPGTGADWGPRLNAIINEIEQTDPIVGGVIECYPEQKKISTTVDAFSGKKAITIRSAGLAPSHIFTGRGYGASFYMGVTGLTMFKHTAQGGSSPSHWGPSFCGITFSAEDFPTTGTLVLLENVNNWGFDHCSFVKGATQLKVTPRLDLDSANDASYGELRRVTFANYSSRGIDMAGGGMAKGFDLNFFDGATGSWAWELGAEAAQGIYGGIKIDCPGGGGIWNKGYMNAFYGISTEGCSVGLRQDKDTGVAWSGQANEYHGLRTLFRNAAGEIGWEVTTNVSQTNAIYGYVPWGTVGAGGSAWVDPNGLMMVVSEQWDDGQGPVLKLPSRFAAPAAPGAGGLLYYRGGWKVRNAAGAEQTITVT